MTTQELDRLAAEKVMGWEVYTAMDDARPITYIDQHLNLQVAACWSPTTNEAHAAMVRERLRELGWDIEISIPSRGSCTVDMCYPNVTPTQDRYVRAEDDEFLLALTTAALLAVGAVTEGEL